MPQLRSIVWDTANGSTANYPKFEGKIAGVVVARITGSRALRSSPLVYRASSPFVSDITEHRTLEDAEASGELLARRGIFALFEG